MTLAQAAAKLRQDETVTTKVHGNSMLPYIRSGDTVSIIPISSFKIPIEVGHIVLAKVHGRYVLHLVGAIHKEMYRIENAKGYINGWTKQVYGIVV